MSSQRTTDGTLRIVLIVLAVLVLAPMLMMLVSVPMMGMMGGIGYGGMMGPYGGSGLWGLGMLLVWLVVLVGGGYLVYRWLSGSGVGADPALQELRLAYARGDLSDEEFEERRSTLECE